jgi:hypothetical protein
VTMLRSSLSMYIFFVYNTFFLIACFVNISPEVTFQIVLVFVPKREVTGGQRKLCNEIHNLYSSPDNIVIIK